MISTPDSILVHLLSVVGEIGDLRRINVNESARTVEFVLSYEDYCHQCHMGRVQGSATLTFDELLKADEPYEPLVGDEGRGEQWYQTYEVRDLIDKRWETNLATKRAKGYRHE